VARTSVFYLSMLGVAVLAFLLIQRLGVHVTAPAPPAGAPLFGGQQTERGTNTLLHVLVALVVIIVAARGLGHAFKWIGQPPVIGEVCAGIMLGPSLLGRIWPETTELLLAPQIVPFLQILSQVGVILFMFLVGLEFDTRLLRRGTHSTIAISHASIVVPFILGVATTIVIYPSLSTSDVPFTVFALFMGVSMSVTAFPVLARILTDRGIQRTRLGVIALACAAVDDVTAWCLLALIVGIVEAQVSDAAATIALTAVFIGIMFVIARPVFARVTAAVERSGRVSQGAVAFVVVALLLASIATESIGIHAIFGAFVVGVLIQNHTLLARELHHRLQDVVLVLFLPAFFAYTGLRTQIGLVNTAEEWLLCALVIAVACLGKFGGTFVAARLTGLDWRYSAALGALMNTRGLMQLIVLNIGMDLRVLGPKLFAIMVIMALVTTMMTSPALALLTRGHDLLAADPHPAGSGSATPAAGEAV
jgi:Kef-type K+ transport system membrane component KefB